MLTDQEKRQKLRGLIQQNLTIRVENETFTDSDHLFSKRLVNSLFAMKLLTFVETEFAITVDDDDMDLENFSSIDRILALINKKHEVYS